MGVEAVQYKRGFYSRADIIEKSNRNAGDTGFLNMGSATRKTTSSDNGKTIGLTTAGSTGYAARYADSSTADNPIVKVGDYEVSIHDVDPSNATELEMFALLSYMEDTGEIPKHGIAAFSKMKAYASQVEYDGVCSGIYDEKAFGSKKQDWLAILSQAKQSYASVPETYAQSLECAKLLAYFSKMESGSDKREKLHSAIQDYVEANKLNALDLKKDKDWREMSDDEWDKMLENLDEYLDAYKEQLKQMKEKQDEAAEKAASEADPDKRAIAASSAALHAAANGVTDSLPPEEADHEKNWTKNLKTDDQTILRTAQEAQKTERMAMSKLQEVQLTDHTITGLSEAEGVMESALVEVDEDQEKIWTITTYNEDGMICQKCKNGKIIDRWEIKYKNSDDAKKVWDYLAGLDAEDDLAFAGSKEFWEDFLKNQDTKL